MRSCDGADQRLVVEAPEVFKAAAAPCHDQNVGPRDRAASRQRVKADDSRRDLGAGRIALDSHRPDEKCIGKRSAMRWMMSRITAPVGDVMTPITAA